jgi:hypothetical protein
MYSQLSSAANVVPAGYQKGPLKIDQNALIHKNSA